MAPGQLVPAQGVLVATATLDVVPSLLIEFGSGGLGEVSDVDLVCHATTIGSVIVGDLLVRRIGRLLPMTDSALVDAALLVRDGRVAWVGADAAVPTGLGEIVELDVEGACVVPGFVDAHTHLVYAGVRRDEFVARLAGVPYDGGGIRVTVEATRAASHTELLDSALGRARAALAAGTTTMEIKTGYGLTPADELKLLAVIAELADRLPLRVEATYLGAHVVPAGRDAEDYVDEVVSSLPAAHAAGARWCDVFCDVGVFSVDQARRILSAAADLGFGLRLHAEEIGPSGGAMLAAELGCASADHLEHVTSGGRRRNGAGRGRRSAAADRHAVAAVRGVGPGVGAARGGRRAGPGHRLQPRDLVV